MNEREKTWTHVWWDELETRPLEERYREALPRARRIGGDGFILSSTPHGIEFRRFSWPTRTAYLMDLARRVWRWWWA